MTVIHLLILELLTLELIGPTFVYFFADKGGFFYSYLMFGRDRSYFLEAYSFAIYGIVVLSLLLLIFVRPLNEKYLNRSFTEISTKRNKQLWFVMISCALVCMMIMFAQNGFIHPVKYVMSLDSLDLAIKRKSLYDTVNMSVYNIGLHVFIAFALFLAITTNSKGLIAITIIVTVIFIPFNLSKSPIADLILQLIFTYLLYKRANTLLIARLFCLFYIAQRDGDISLGIVFEALVARIFLGEFSALPSYFEAFANTRSSLLAILPPYITTFTGEEVKGTSQVVMELLNFDSSSEAAGYANSFFVGSAYAYAGYLGAIIAPFWVFMNFWVVFKIFNMFRKNIFSNFLFGYLIFKLSKAVLSDMAYFVFSGIQIMTIAFILLKILEQTYFKWHKNKISYQGA